MPRLIIIGLYLIVYFVVSIPLYLIEAILRLFNHDASVRSSIAIICFGLKCVAFLAGARMKVNGLENIPKNETVLFVGNHQSYFDIITTYPLMKQKTSYVAKKELKRIPLVGWWMCFADCVFLDRDDVREGLKAILKASDLAKNGTNVFLFPEGGISKDGRIHRFKNGSLKIATKSECPIVPVGIDGTPEIFENHIPWIKSSNVTISFGKPIPTKGMQRADEKNLSKVLRDEVSLLSGHEKSD